MQIYAAYIAVLAAYSPGLYFLYKAKYTSRFPLLAFCFIGLFLFNAAGSILVFKRHYKHFESFLSGEYVLLLILQVAVFYFVAGTYIMVRGIPRYNLKLSEFDVPTAIVFVPIIVGILAWYYSEAGRFLLSDLLSGKMTYENILEYRQATYGLPWFPYFRLGFVVFPAILAAQCLLIGLVQQRVRGSAMLGIVVCLVPPLLLGDKAGVLYLVPVLFIAYSLYKGSHGLGVFDVFSPRVVFWLGLAFVPTVVAYFLYYHNTLSISEIGNKFVFRIVGAYTEAIAAVVPFVKEHGYLGGSTLPNIKGLFPHERISVEAVLHEYLTHFTFVTRFEGLPGSISVPTVAEGYINFGWLGAAAFSFGAFVSVTFMQELLLRLRMGLLSFSLMAWYAYLSMSIAMTSVFATIVSFVHTYVLVFCIILFWAIRLLVTKKAMILERP